MKLFFIPQLKKAREATDVANIRAAYAEVITAAVSGDTTTTGDGKSEPKYTKGTGWTMEVTPTQTTPGWQNDVTFPDNLTQGTSQITKDTTVTITVDEDGNATITCKLDKE